MQVRKGEYAGELVPKVKWYEQGQVREFNLRTTEKAEQWARLLRKQGLNPSIESLMKKGKK